MSKLFTILFLLSLLTLNVSEAFSKTYKIGCVDDFYPYISVNKSGELEGLIIDWWKLWSDKAEVEIEFVQLDIQSCLDKTKSGELDAIAAMFYSDERAEYLTFSDPLLRMKTELYLKKGIKPESVNELEVAVSAVENSKPHHFLESEYPGLEIRVLESHSDLLKQVFLKEIDAFPYTIPNPIVNHKPYSDPEGYYSFTTLFEDKLRPVVAKENTKMLNLIISGTSKITDEELLLIASKWELFEEDKSLLYTILAVGFVLLLSIAVLVIFILKNKRQTRKITDFQTKTDWEVIIQKGETDFIEFKSSLRWDYRQEKINKTLELVIAKTISAFLNTEGGMLFIGVDDEGNALGLEKDYQSFSKKNRDGFLLALTNIINQNLGKSCHKFISINIVALTEKDVCIVSAEKSDKPVFLGKGDKEEFYIRASASSQPLGMRETYQYINSHWK